MNGIRLRSIAGAHPNHMVTNEDLAKIVDTSDEWITSRSGIKTRYFCEDGETCNSLAIEAAKKALDASGLMPEEISCVITATISGDYATPSVSCMIQKVLGLREDIPAMDINAACSGFIYAMTTARALLMSMNKKYALVIGVEQLSRLLDMTDRSTCVLFGDGGGAAVIEIEEELPYSGVLGAKGGREILCGGAGMDRMKIEMDGKAVFRFAVTAMPHCIESVLEQSSLTLGDIDYVICHQANSRIIDHCVKKLKADPEKFPQNMDRYGNTSAGSIPLVLSDLYEAGKLKSDQKILLIGFGSGLTWGGLLISIGCERN